MLPQVMLDCQSQLGTPDRSVPLQTYFLQTHPELALSAPSISQTTQAASATTSTCSGSHHFGKWCHTSIRRQVQQAGWVA